MRKLIKSIGILAIGTLLSKILGFVRELVVSYKFGTGSVSDAFVLTNSIPNSIFSAIAMAVSINFIPVFVTKTSRAKKNIFTSRLLNLYLVILSIGCVFIIAFPKLVMWIFATELSYTTYGYAVIMLRIVALSAFPVVMATIFQAYSQGEESFVSTALYGVVVNIIVIIVTFIASAERYYLLSVGTVVSYIVGFIIMYISAKRSGFRYIKHLGFRDDGIKQLFILTLPLLMENIANNLSEIVDKNIASSLDVGTISGVGYANTIANIAYSVISIPIVTAIYPRYCQMAEKKDMKAFEGELSSDIQTVVYILSGIAVFMIVCSEDIVRIVFERGAFTSESTQIVSQTMKYYAVGTAFAGINSLLLRGFYALKETRRPAMTMVFALACNIALNISLVRILQHRGIALSTSLSFIIASELLLYLLNKVFEINIIGRVNVEVVKSTCAAGGSAFLTYAGIRYIGSDNLYVYIVLFLVVYILLYTAMLASVSRDFRREVSNLFYKANK